MKTISFLNRKGGVGKTSVCANLAYELSRTGYLTLVIDLDSQCDITEFFANLNPSNKMDLTNLNIRNVLEGECTIDDSSFEAADNLYFVPGSPDLDEFDFRYSQQALRDKLQSPLLSEVDFVLIDNPPNINEAVRCGLVASDYVVVVTEIENPAMNNLKKVNHQLDAVKQSLNPDLTILGIALNKIDLRRNLTRRHIEQVKKEYGYMLFESYISIDSALPNSLDKKVPVRGLKWRSRTLTQFQRLLAEILQRLDGMEGQNEE